jgi:phage terminase large subunit-like protein
VSSVDELGRLILQLDREKKIHRLHYYTPYPKQIAFHHAQGANGQPAAQRYLMAANQFGKTFCGCMEVAMHATGWYPKWWKGHRFVSPVKVLVVSETNELTRDRLQAELIGPPENEKEWGTGSIPIECLGKNTRKAGVPNALDSIRVKHASGGSSSIAFRCYEQGARKFMAMAYDVILCDEEPPIEIWSQCQRSTFAKNHYVAMVTATPEQGMTEIATQFMNDLQPNQALINATWDDALHMTAHMKEEKLRTIPKHERDMRSRGVPLMGAGLVFPFTDDELMCEPFPIPRHWPRIVGIDFGWDHPFGAALLAWDRDSDTVYLCAEYQSRKELPVVHAHAIRAWGDWIPVAWPHDGLNGEKGTGKQLVSYYRDAGLRTLPDKASNPPEPGQEEGEGGSSWEAALLDMVDRMESGRWKVFRSCQKWFEEKRMYHRDTQGKLVRLNDDVISASRHAHMMLRHARVQQVARPMSHARPGISNWA